MRWTIRIFQVALLTFLTLVIWTNRVTFFSPFDAEHWKDKYEHSQWKLPLSVRILGDDGLYLYEGYRLVHGGDPTLLNAEVPPLGKYLIGTSIRIFGNGNVYGLLVNISILALVFFLAKKITNAPLLAWGTTLLLASDPLFTAQYSITMLDGLQSLWLLAYLALLFASATSRKKTTPLLTVCSGIALGFFSETKFPVLTAVLLPLGSLYLWKTHNRLRSIWHLVAGCAAGYVLPYLPYFLSGHSPIEWVKVQKWIIAFYMHSKLIPTWGSALVNILIGQYQNIFSREWLPSPQWTPVWTLMLGLSFAHLRWKRWNLKTYPVLMLATLSVAILVFYSVIPFWTRYLVLLLPLWYVAAAATLRRASATVQTIIITICIAINVGISIPQLFPTPEGTVKLFVYNWENSFFQDMYEDTTWQTKAGQTRDMFRSFGLLQTQLGQFEKVHITTEVKTWPRFVSSFSVPVTIRYTTRYLGEFTVHSTLRLVNEKNKWRVDWAWSDYLPDLSVDTNLTTVVLPATRGSILGSDKKPLAEDIPSILITVSPSKIDPNQEVAMLKYLEGLFEQKIPAVHIHQRIYGNTLPGGSVAIGVVPRLVTEKEKQQLLSYRGVSWIDHVGRTTHKSDFIDIGSVANSLYFECCSRLYSTTNYDGVDGAEKKKNDILKGTNGGSLRLETKDGRVIHTFIKQEKKDGANAEP